MERLFWMLVLGLGLVLGVESGSQDDGRFRIDETSVLLPTEKGKSVDGAGFVDVKMKLSAEPGCFEWMSSDPSIASVEIVDDERCPAGFGRSVWVRSLNNSTEKKSCEVSALQYVDGEEVAVIADVYTAPIHRFEIMTTVNPFPVFETQTLEIQAFDDQGNVFSSLSGLEFAWEHDLVREGKNQDHQPLRMSKISESNLTAKEGLDQEYFGHYGYQVQIMGIHPGRSLVKATLLNAKPAINTDGDGNGNGNDNPSSKKSDLQAKVEIDVVESLQFCPFGPILIPGTKLRNQIFRKINKHDYELLSAEESSLSYQYSSTAPNVVSIDQSSGIMIAQDHVGRAEITFGEKDYLINTKSEAVRVVEPRGLKLSFAEKTIIPEMDHRRCPWNPNSRFPLDVRLPHITKWSAFEKRWILTLGKSYYVMATIDSKSLQTREMIYVTEDMAFEFSVLQTESLPEVDRKRSGTTIQEGQLTVLSAKEYGFLDHLRIVRADKPGFVDLESSFSKLQLSVRKNAIQITAPIVLAENLIRLPLDTENLIFHSYKLIPSGGTGLYLFSVPRPTSKDGEGPSRERTIAVDENLGVIRIHQQSRSNETVVVADRLDPSNQAEAVVLVTAPSAMRFVLENGKELDPADSSLYVSIGEMISIRVRFMDAHGKPFHNCTGFFKSVEWTLKKNAGQGGHIEPQTDKRIVVNDHSICSGQNFMAKKPGKVSVTARYGIQDTIKVIVGERVKITHPVPNLQIEPSGIPVALIGEGTSTLMKVTGGKRKDEIRIHQRMNEGELQLIKSGDLVSVELVNGENDGLLRTYQVKCHQIGAYEIVVQEHARMALICKEPSSTVIMVTGEELPKFSVEECLSQYNQHYMVNARSLSLMLSVLDNIGNAFTDVSSYSMDWKLADQPNSLVRLLPPAEGEQSLRQLKVERDVEGNIQIEATVHTGKTELTASTVVGVANDINFEPSHIRPIVAAHGAESKVFVVNGPERLGSSLDCRITSYDHALISIHQREVSIQFTGDQNKIKGNSNEVTLTCHMPCLMGSKQISTTVNFQEAVRLHVTGPTKVRESSEFELSIQALDASGRVFSAEMHSFLGLKLLGDAFEFLGEDLTPVACADGSSNHRTCDGKWVVKAVARRSGDFAIQASSLNGTMIGTHRVHVFRGIEIVPGHDRTIEPGVRFRLKRAFGPFPDPKLCQFHCDNTNVISIKDESNGIFFTEKLGIATIKVVCLEDGKNINEAQLRVRVKRLEQMEILPKIIHMVAGKELRLHAHFPELSEDPIDLDTVQRTFAWEIQNTTIAESKSAEADSFSIWIQAMEPGATTIRVESRSPDGASTSLLVGETKLIVEPALKLDHETVVMPRRGVFQIRTSHDELHDGGVLTYFVGSKGCTHRNPPITVSENGLITAGDHIGAVTVLVEHRKSLKDVEVVQEVSVLVKVSAITNVGVEPYLDTLTLPIGVTYPVYVSLFNNLGERFTAPFNTVKVLGNGSDTDVLALEEEGECQASSSEYVIHFRTLMEGSVMVVLNAESLFDGENARNDHGKVIVLEPSQGFRFLFTDESKPIIVVPNSNLRVPFKSNFPKQQQQNLGCTATIGKHHHLTGSINEEDSYCIIHVPETILTSTTTMDVIRIALTLSEKEVHVVTKTMTIGFSFTSEDAEISNDDRLIWPEGKSTIKLKVVGKNATSISMATHDLLSVKRLPRQNEFQVRLKARRNDTCGQDTAMVFVDTETGQQLRWDLEFPCIEYQRKADTFWLFRTDPTYTFWGPFVVGAIFIFIYISLKRGSNDEYERFSFAEPRRPRYNTPQRKALPRRTGGTPLA